MDYSGDFPAALPNIPDKRSKSVLATAFSADGPVLKAAGIFERTHIAALSFYWTQLPQLLPMGAYTA